MIETKEERCCNVGKIEIKLNMLFEEIMDIKLKIERANINSEIEKIEKEIREKNKELEYRKDELKSIYENCSSKEREYRNIWR